MNLALLAGSGGAIGPYEQIIGASVIILLSYGFDILAKRFKIPSVILLIGLGIGLNWALQQFLGIKVDESIIPVLSVIGTIGIILIVLEAALDLKLHKEKTSIIYRSFLVALLVLLVTAFAIAFVLIYFLNIELLPALVYATPLSFISSAIVIPSVGNLTEHKKEFMIYEATFADILGIIMFFFLTGFNPEEMSVQGAIISELLRTVLTVAISVVVSYGLVYFISKVSKKANFFTIFAVLALVYALGKKFHLSSLITILVFGLILNNEHVFFKGYLDKLISKKHHYRIVEDFKLLTHQSAFLVRTFFFVVFGMIISVSSLKEPQVLLIAGLIILIIYIVRFAQLQLVQEHSIVPELFIAPRGLVTILLFFSIPERFQLDNFNDGIMSVVIIVTALVMMIALIFSKKEYQIIEDLTTHTNTGLLGYGRDVDAEGRKSKN